MRTPSRVPIRHLALAAVLTTLTLWPGPSAAQGRQDSEPEPGPAAGAAGCENSCRGLGIRKVQAGGEHCGLIPRETKGEALDAACRLAESDRESLQEQAEERARGKCGEQVDQDACRCRTELRAWQNVYTHVLSKNCWTECGWAFLIECERRSEADEG